MLTLILSLLWEPIFFLLSLLPLPTRIFNGHDHYAPHPAAPFEGYYTRIVTPTATILLIISSVNNARDKPHYVHFSYHPHSPSSHPPLRIDLFPSELTPILGHRDRVSGVQLFTYQLSNLGHFSVLSTSQYYSLRLPTLTPGTIDVQITLKNRTPWDGTSPHSSPEGPLSNLFNLLPVHWYVFSTNSVAEYSITSSDSSFVPLKGIGAAHLEKNWGASFPSAWTWVQALSPPPADTSGAKGFNLVLAGGRTLFQKAYLVGYSSPNITIPNISFAPPLSLLPFGFSTPFISERVNSRAGTFELVVSGWRYRLHIRARGSPNHDGWVALSCPLRSGHGNLLAYETFEAVVGVTVEERVGFWGWKVVEEVEMVGAALEFGGEYSFKVRDEVL